MTILLWVTYSTWHVSYSSADGWMLDQWNVYMCVWEREWVSVCMYDSEIYFCRRRHMSVINNSCRPCQISGNMDRGPLKNCAPETSERNWKNVRKRKVEPVRGVCQRQWHSMFHSTNNSCQITCRNSYMTFHFIGTVLLVQQECVCLALDDVTTILR